MVLPLRYSGLSLLAIVAATGCGDEGAGARVDSGTEPVAPLRVQVFSRTTGYRHEAIEPAQRALRRGASERGEEMPSTEDPAVLVDGLADSDVIVFLMTTGDVLDDAQQHAFEAYIRGGGGYVGVHSATDTEYDWPFYGELIGAWFASHTGVVSGRVVVEASSHPTAAFLPSSWERHEEWYDFKQNPRERPGTQVVLRVDESSYSGGKMGPDHPIAWAREIDRGRAYYTAFGHPPEAWDDPLLVRHVEAAIRWAARRP